MSNLFSQRRQQLPSLKQIWKQLQHLPPPQTEESIPLRILVQLLVAVGIIATDLAAGTTFSFWTIPVSISVPFGVGNAGITAILPLNSSLPWAC